MKMFCSFLLLGLGALAQAAAPLASGNVSLAPKLTDQAKGIRTLFISVYDSANPAPMPYGAAKFDLTEDAKGRFTRFTLDDSTMLMRTSGNTPAKINIKAKLSKAGTAGPDASGDLIGWAKGVKPGNKKVAIKIDQAIP